MNIKRLMALALTLCLALALCACGQSQVDVPADEPSNAPAVEQSETPSEQQTDASVENTNPTYTVKIVDEGGNPIEGVMVQICQGETCMPGPATGADGVVTFQVVEADYKVSFLGGVPAGYDYTTEETEFHFEAGSYEMTIVLKAVA